MNINGPIMKLRKLHAAAVIPMQGSDWSAGLDCYSYQEEAVQPWSLGRIKLGFAITLPWEFCGMIHPVIGLAMHSHVFALPGMIDPDSRSEVEASIKIILEVKTFFLVV